MLCRPARMGLHTIALNVNQRNAAAIRVYERLGFARHCAFYEGIAVRDDESRQSVEPEE
jgi:RimJ/RimL family protein N-acetyltransferase